MTKTTPDTIASTIEEMVRNGECTITKEKSGVVYEIKPTKIGQRKGKSASIKEINDTIADGIELGLKKKKYRKREDLPDPSKPANDPANLRKKPVTLRCLPELTVAMNRAAERDGTRRNDWINEAIEEKLKRDHPALWAEYAETSEPDEP